MPLTSCHAHGEGGIAALFPAAAPSLRSVVACSRCGRSSDDVPLDWVVETAPQRQYCPACAREHLRSIEANLDEAYW
jgi:hypothetical protein